ncbi:MAG: WXG100 family type VII secretion target [Nocardioidaceae bacterium]
MTRFTVDLEELDAVIGDMTGFEGRFTGKIAELDALIADLHVSWTGEAAGAQKGAHQEWAAGAREMHRALVSMREAAQRAHANYTAAADANARMWEQAL